eukprot:6183351-Pleurochrysis_carterae.AAC.1
MARCARMHACVSLPSPSSSPVRGHPLKTLDVSLRRYSKPILRALRARCARQISIYSHLTSPV